ncbi:mediator of RNA polymerase II transcription subunit 30 [Daktulosphaira vitifoliae]|uniref:mediator of RNA polymerase II transcription subunit 30 n=1 Tax=Daktulosphaira vitifoliae TaxID=58002 RepID=UPI0021AA209B|nr:mediator of RNA polymerase II transcription subunit 30 [Daktulosphaira vitifoliae]
MQPSQAVMVGQQGFNVGPVLQPNMQPQVPGTQHVLAPPVNQNPVGVSSVSQPSVPPSNPNQSTSSNQFNTATLCRFGQETVQEIVSRTHEVFQILKVIMPPNGTPSGATMSNDRRIKMQDHLRHIKLLFKRLRIIYEKCNDSCQLQGMEYMHMEGLIPLQEEWDMKSEEKKTSETYRVVNDELKEVSEQLNGKNRHLKEIIDHLRRIIWEINTMLAMRRS